MAPARRGSTEVTLLAALLFIPKLKVGDSWSYLLTSRFVSADLDLTNEESVKIRVEKITTSDIQLIWAQKLENTVMGSERIPTDVKVKPAERKWSLFPSGKVAFTEFERHAQEGILQRVLRAAFDRDTASGEWTVEFTDETATLSPAAVGLFRQTKNKVRSDAISYRAADGTRSIGSAIWNSKLLFPELLTLNIPRTRLPGGDEWMSCKIELKYVPPPPANR